MPEELLTVEAVSEALQLHPKTVLRFIREGRLRATKVGKQYRILRSDLDSFSGAPPRAVGRSRATCIVDIDDVDPPLHQRLSAITLGVRKDAGTVSEPLSIDLAHDPLRRSIKIIGIGAPGDLAMLLRLVDACLEA